MPNYTQKAISAWSFSMRITVDLQEPMLGSIMETYMASSPFLPACRMSKSKSTHGEYLNPFLQACFSGVRGIFQLLSSLRSKRKAALKLILIQKCTPVIHVNSSFTGFLMNEPSLDCRIQSVWLLLAANEVVPAQSSLHRKNSTDLQSLGAVKS